MRSQLLNFRIHLLLFVRLDDQLGNSFTDPCVEISGVDGTLVLYVVLKLVVVEVHELVLVKLAAFDVEFWVIVLVSKAEAKLRRVTFVVPLSHVIEELVAVNASHAPAGPEIDKFVRLGGLNEAFHQGITGEPDLSILVLLDAVGQLFFEQVLVLVILEPLVEVCLIGVLGNAFIHTCIDR